MAEAFAPTRADAWALLNTYTKSESLLKHALAVEVCMRAYARHFNANEEEWAVTALLHDMDYEQHPTAEEHPMAGVAILREQGYPEDIVEAIMGHANYLQVPRRTLMAKTLYAVDELTGFVSAVALVRPSKKVADVEYSSVKKKMKDKAFARTCNREEMLEGATELGVEFDEHVRFVISAMADKADILGL